MLCEWWANVLTECVNCSAQLPDGARFCPNCATPVAAAPAAEERKLATVLFADLVGSTAFASARDPEYVRDILDRYYDAMSAEILDRGGTLEKFIGDAVVAVFGAPAAREDHAERALDAALAMQVRFEELFGADELGLRIGVNTGEVVLGRARQSSSFVSGDTVNTAARLEAAAPSGHVLAGERTVAAVGAAFEFDVPITVTAKGKPAGIPARVLLRMVSPTRPRGRLTQMFVGREDELSELARDLAACIEQQLPRFVVIVGDPGLGKSSLVAQFRARISAGVMVRIGRCVSFGRGATYSPLADVLREDPDLPAVLERRTILGVTLGDPAPADLDPRVVAEQLRAAWVELLSELATEQPVVLVVEDLHGASQPLLALLARMATDVRGPVFLLATVRPDAMVPEGLRRLSLDPLSPSEVDTLLTELLGEGLPADARELIVRRAEGNPFFLEEITASFIDRGLLKRDDDAWSWHGSVDAVDVPDSVQAVLAARIDLLSAPAKSALQAASVIGRVLDEAALAELGATDQIDVLVRRGFLQVLGDDLVFKHALTREVAYGTLPKAKRAALHATYALWLEQTTGSIDAQAAALASHYAQAVEPDIAPLAWRGREAELERLTLTAIDWSRRAADVAIRGYDIESALGHLHQAAKLAPGDAQLWRAIGRANALIYAGQAYWDAMLHAIELASDPVQLGEIYAELALESLLRAAMWQTAPDPQVVDGWAEKAVELTLPDSLGRARALTAHSLAHDDDATADAAIAIAQRHGDHALVSNGYLTHWATATMVRIDYHEAYDWAMRGSALAESVTDPDRIATIHQASVAAALALARFDEADEHVHRMAAVAERLSPHHAVHVMGARTSRYEAMDDWAAIRELQPEIERMVASATSPCSFNARLLMSCAVAAADAGLDGEASRLEAATDSLGLDSYRLWFDPLRARLAVGRDDLERLAVLVEDADRWGWALYVHCFAIRAHLDALLALGRYGDAARQADRYNQPGSYLEPFALWTLAVVHDDPDRATHAAQLFQAMGLSRAVTRAAHRPHGWR